MGFHEEYKKFKKGYKYDSKDVEILLDTDEVFLVKVNSFETAQYFGPKFITDSYKRKYSQEYHGDLYFIVNKLEKPKKDYYPICTIFIGNDGETKYYFPTGREVSFSDILEEFPSAEKELIKLNSVSDTYQMLLNISNGIEPTKQIIFSVDDDLIKEIKFNSKIPGKSFVYLDFYDQEDYFRLFDFSDDDIWYMKAIIGSRYSFEYDTIDNIENDWIEGYLIPNFNDENILKMKEILKFINPSLMNFNNQNFNDELNSSIAKTFSDLFPKQVDNFLYDYVDEINACKTESEREAIKKELCNIFQPYGIVGRNDCFGSYMTTVNILLKLYEHQKNYRLDLKGLLKSVGDKISVNSYYEYYYETYCNDSSFDDEINRVWSNELDKILEKIESDPDFFGDEEVRLKFIKYVVNKYNIGNWYDIPSEKGNKDKRFQLGNYNIRDNKITILYKDENKTERRSYDIDGFVDFLYNRELFEKKIMKYRKL